MMVSKLTTLCWLILLLLLQACSQPASVIDALDGHDANTSVSGAVVLGQHPTTSQDPGQFVPIEDGDDINVVLGAQGLFMIVLGLKSQAYFSGPMQLHIDIATGSGDEVASLALQGSRTVRAPDGNDYVWELQVIVDGEIWIDQPLSLRLSAVDESGKSFENSYSIVLVKPPVINECVAPSPSSTGATDTCTLPAGLPHYLESGGVDSLHMAAGPSEGSFVVGAHRGANLLLWSSLDDVSPFPNAHHLDFGNTGPWVEPSAVNAGPWAFFIPAAGPALVWGGSDGVTRFTAPGGEPTVLGTGRPLTAFAAPDGFKVLIDQDGVVRIHAFGPDAGQTASHFVVNMAKAGGPLATSPEGDLVVVTFPGTTPEQPMMYQTASIFGGQCSLPAPLGLALGEGTVREAFGVSYGLPFLAVTRPPVEVGCGPSYRIVSKPLSGTAFLDAESSVSWVNGAQVVARDGVAAAVGLQELADGWRLAAQFADQAQLVPGKSAVGPVVGGVVPDHWDVTHSGRYGAAWSDASGVWLQRFCFADAE